MVTPANKLELLGAAIQNQETRHKAPKLVLGAVFGRMQFTLYATRRTPHRASRLVQAMSAWLVKTRRAPSRHSRVARVCGHTTTAMHKLSTPPPHRSLRRPAIATTTSKQFPTSGAAQQVRKLAVERKKFSWHQLGASKSPEYTTHPTYFKPR